MSTYKKSNEYTADATYSDERFTLEDFHLYGSSRLGTKNEGIVLHDIGNNQSITGYDDSYRVLGTKYYELSNHLGNVLQVISDRKLMASSATIGGVPTVTSYNPDVISYSDYYPFGMLMPNRYTGNSEYRYGFQGQEQDNEIKGQGNSVNFKFRMHDPRVGRFFATDPLESIFMWNSPYAFAENQVIRFIELEGLEKATPDRIAKANKAILAFKNSEHVKGEQKIANISKAELINYLNKRINNPELKSHYNSCGPTSASYVAITHDPEKFVEIMIALWKNGKTDNGALVVPDILKSEESHYRSNDDIDQVIEGSLILGESVFGKYYKSKPSGTKAERQRKLLFANATRPAEYVDYINNMGISVSASSFQNTNSWRHGSIFKIYSKFLDIKGYHMVMFGYYDGMMGKKFKQDPLTGGDHYVTVSSISYNDKTKKVTVNFWHHGEYKNNGYTTWTGTIGEFRNTFKQYSIVKNTGNETKTDSITSE